MTSTVHVGFMQCVLRHYHHIVPSSIPVSVHSLLVHVTSRIVVVVFLLKFVTWRNRTRYLRGRGKGGSKEHKSSRKTDRICRENYTASTPCVASNVAQLWRINQVARAKWSMSNWKQYACVCRRLPARVLDRHVRYCRLTSQNMTYCAHAKII